MKPQGRIYQDSNFNVSEYTENTLEKLIGWISNTEKPNEPDIIYIKTKEKNWQQFFLDTHIGVWENWGKFEKEEEDEKYIDYTLKFNIEGQKINSINCHNGTITLKLESNKTIKLQLIDPENNDTSSILVIKN
jgi:hypothetical protein